MELLVVRYHSIGLDVVGNITGILVVSSDAIVHECVCVCVCVCVCEREREREREREEGERDYFVNIQKKHKPSHKYMYCTCTTQLLGNNDTYTYTSCFRRFFLGDGRMSPTLFSERRAPR